MDLNVNQAPLVRYRQKIKIVVESIMLFFHVQIYSRISQNWKRKKGLTQLKNVCFTFDFELTSYMTSFEFTSKALTILKFSIYQT